MDFNYIAKKLVRNNIKEYFLTIFGIAFAVFVIAALGIIVFSPSVSRVFYPGGTSQQLSYGMYMMTMLACIVFVIFIQSLFMRYKAKEIGVFMSLGVRKKDISRLIKKELRLIVPLAAIIGIVLSIPGSMLLWNSLALFFNNQESKFRIGWLGIIFAVAFAILTYFVIKIVTNSYVKKMNLIKLLRTTSEIEKVAFGKTIFGIIGFICIPLGLICIILGASTSHPVFRRFFSIGLVTEIVGIYLFATQVPAYGSIVKMLGKNKYLKNIVFLNLLKLKGKQFTLSLFIGTILIAIGLFSLFFNVGSTIESSETIRNSKYDFGYFQLAANRQLNKNDITALASKYKLKVLQYKELDGVLLTQYGQLTDFSDEWYWGDDTPFISESSFNKFFNENVKVSKGKYIMAVKYNKSTDMLNELLRPRYRTRYFTAEKRRISITPEKSIEIKNKMFDAGIFTEMLRVLNDEDYNKIQRNVAAGYRFKYKTFNVDKYDKSIKFSNAFYKEYLKIHGYQFPKHFASRGSNQINGKKAIVGKITKITPELKRNWTLLPYSRIDSKLNGVNDAVVYFLVFGIIAIFCLVASGLIIGIKILSSMWEEKLLFRNISLLGCKKEYIKSIILKQVLLLYTFPNVLASIIILSIFTVNYNDAMVYLDKIIFVSYFITILIISFSIILSIMISKKVQKECIKFISVN